MFPFSQSSESDNASDKSSRNNKNDKENKPKNNNTTIDSKGKYFYFFLLYALFTIGNLESDIACWVELNAAFLEKRKNNEKLILLETMMTKMRCLCNFRISVLIPPCCLPSDVSINTQNIANLVQQWRNCVFKKKVNTSTVDKYWPPWWFAFWIFAYINKSKKYP